MTSSVSGLKTAQRYTKPLLWIVVYLVIAAALGEVTRANIPEWYVGLQKPFLTPPDFVFGIVWSMLYVLLAVVGWYLWDKRHEEAAKLPQILYWAQMALNWGWTFIFFHFHLIAVGAVWIEIINILIIVLIAISWKRYRIVSYLMLPTLLWCCFAAYLNFMIWMLN